MAKKYKPVDHDIEVKDTTVYGTKDNDIFHITSGTADKVEIYPKNQATDMLFFDNLALTSINATHINGTKDIKITYVHNSEEKSLIIKDYFSSTKATAPKSSLKNLHYTKSDTEYYLSVATDLLFDNLAKNNTSTKKVTGSNFADYIDLSAETSSYKVNGGKGSDYIIGTDQDDTLNGNDGNDYIYGKNGNDILTGGKGNNIYAYDEGASANGNDTINLTKGETAIINYDGNSSKFAYKLDGKGNALIYFDDTNENSNYITLKDFSKKDSVNEIKFVSTDNTENLKNVYWNYSPTDNYNGSYLNEHIDAKNIQEAKKDKQGNPVAYSFKTGDGDDIIEASDFTDKITAGVGENEIRYTSLDQLSGDTIYLTKNENLTIDLTGISGNSATAGYELSGKNLVVYVTSGTVTKTFTIANYGTQDVTGANGTVTVIDQRGATDLKKEALVFVDGTKGTFHNDIMNGNANNNTIKGGAGNDIITGGAGNDKLYGEAGKNTLVFNTGDGKDTVYGGAGEDTLEFSGKSIKDLQFSRGTTKNSKNDLIIKYSQNDSVTIKNYYVINKKTKLPTTSVKYIKTTEGTIYIDPLKIVIGEGKIDGDDNVNIIFGSNLSDTIKAYGENDIIYGGDGDDIINGGEGNDTLTGGDGHNTFVFMQDDGKDVITDATSADIIKLEFDPMESASFTSADGKLVITFDENNSITTNFDSTNPENNINTILVKDENVEGGYREINILNDIIFDKILEDGEVYEKITPYTERITLSADATSATVSGLGEKDFIYLGEDCEDDAACVGNAITFTFDNGDKSITISDFFDEAGDIVFNGGVYIDGTAIYDKYEQVALSDINLTVSERTKFNNTINVEEEVHTIFHTVNITGTDGDDTYTGGEYDDTINGDKGNDTIYGGEGDDSIYGGNGYDVIYGGDGDDTIYGNNARDTIYGGDGDDLIFGGDGQDDNDDIYTGTGDDTIYGGSGYSINVTLVDSGDKTIVSGVGELYDILVFLNETSTSNLIGHISGNDLVVSDSTGTSARLKNYFTEGHRVELLYVQEKNGGHIGVGELPIEIISDASIINGTDLKDSITATNDNGVVINGYAGNDTIYVGAGNDTINAGIGTNTIVINTGNKIIEDGGGVDTIVFNMETNLDNLIRYISGNNLVITDSEGNSATLLDYFQNSHSVKTVKVGNKTRNIDDVSVQAPNNYIIGTKNDDTLNGSINDDVIYGCAGNDTINGDAGNDTLIGGIGNDVIDGGDGDDIIDGGDGADTINGGAGNNIIYLASGNKIIENGGGVDTIVFNNETNIDNLRGQVSGNDLVITDSTGTSATLTNYFTDGHSVSVLQVGYMTINIADLSNIITSDASVINGTNLKDIITATNENGAIINGLAGNDIINGSAGDDTINGSAGTDTIYGGEGKDTIYGGDGADAIYGNAGVDYLYGENGDDAIYGGDGADAIYSGTGADFISGGAGNNTIYLDSGNKTIVNGGGNDTLVYVNETDINNLKVSVSGNNLIITDSTGTSATLLNYSDGHSVSEIQLIGYMPRDINDFSNYIKSGESTINGTFFHDFITVTTDSSHQIYGKEGNDEIHGGNGANYIWGDYDEYSSNIGHDTIYGGDSNDHLYGRLGNDEIHGGGGDDSIYGDGDNDILYGDSGNDYINGGDGDDEIYGDDGADSLYGGAGDDTIYGGTDKDTIDGAEGNDSIEGGAGNDDVEGGGGNDTIYGGDGDDIIKGSNGNDSLFGGAGDDKYIQKANNLADYDEIYDEAGDNDSLEINYNESDIILRFDVKVDQNGDIIEADSKNMYITSTSDFGNTEKGVKVTDQFVSGHSIENIKTADNYALTTTQINQLRSDIAGWLHQNEFESVQDVLDSHDETVIGNLLKEFQKADWQPVNG